MGGLKPCPFCGAQGEDLILLKDDYAGRQIKCWQCKAYGPVARTDTDAKEKWNDRTGTTDEGE